MVSFYHSGGWPKRMLVDCLGVPHVSVLHVGLRFGRPFLYGLSNPPDSRASSPVISLPVPEQLHRNSVREIFRRPYPQPAAQPVAQGAALRLFLAS